MRIIGVDPGLGGAIAVLDENGKLCALEDMPVITGVQGGKTRREIIPHALGQLVADVTAGEPAFAFVERVSARPGEGVGSAFRFGLGFGMVQGILGARMIAFELLTPQQWRKSVSLTGDKGSARALASRLYPEYAKGFSRVKDDGRAEAALIARAGYFRFHGDPEYYHSAKP